MRGEHPPPPRTLSLNAQSSPHARGAPLENVLVVVAVIVPNENLSFTIIVKAGKTVPVINQDGLCLFDRINYDHKPIMQEHLEVVKVEHGLFQLKNLFDLESVIALRRLTVTQRVLKLSVNVLCHIHDKLGILRI